MRKRQIDQIHLRKWDWSICLRLSRPYDVPWLQGARSL